MIVKMHVWETQQTIEVKCRLLWTFQWIQAVIELWDNRKLAAQQLIEGTFNIIEYRLDPNTGSQAIGNIALFLKDLVREKRKRAAWMTITRRQVK